MWFFFRRLSALVQKCFYPCLSFFRLRLWRPPPQVPVLSPHMQNIVESAKRYSLQSSMSDHFHPVIPLEDGPEMATMNLPYISYYYTERVFIKRQPHRDEMGDDIYGNPVVVPYIADRLRNEAAALAFLAEHAPEVPVPKLLGLWEDLKTAMEHRGVEMSELDASVMPTALALVTAQLEDEILPRLHSLHRNCLGSADPPRLPVVPPRRHWDFKGTLTFPTVPLETDEYTFIHTDMDRQNLLVDPETFRIVCIIDWETAGFFPVDWELPFWKMDSHQEKHAMFLEAREREKVIFFNGFDIRV